MAETAERIADAFDAAEFAAKLARAMDQAGVSARALGERIPVSHVTISRALAPGGWPTLSHQAWLQLEAWMDLGERKAAA